MDRDDLAGGQRLLDQRVSSYLDRGRTHVLVVAVSEFQIPEGSSAPAYDEDDCDDYQFFHLYLPTGLRSTRRKPGEKGRWLDLALIRLRRLWNGWNYLFDAFDAKEMQSAYQ